ncbi:hypothetical protein D3C81_1595300 [compost metagenome]
MRNQFSLQPVQRPIRKGRADDAALWRSSCGCHQLLPVNYPGFQPFRQDRLVHEDIVDQPLMVDIVEKTFDIRIQHPGCRDFPAGLEKNLRHRIGR